MGRVTVIIILLFIIGYLLIRGPQVKNVPQIIYRDATTTVPSKIELPPKSKCIIEETIIIQEG
jgi:hypothetical protein